MNIWLLLICTLADEQKEGREMFFCVDCIAAENGFKRVVLQLVLHEQMTQECHWSHPYAFTAVRPLLTIMHLFSPGSVCLAGEWPPPRHPGTSADSTASWSEPGRRAVPELPPRFAHLHPAVRT